jgi:hypothetical protein
MSPSVWDDIEIDARLQSIVPSIPKMKERCQATTHISERTLARQLKAM